MPQYMVNLVEVLMSFTSGKKRLYDIFLDRLNENPYGVTFSGNFMFKFWQQGQGINEFEIMYKETDVDGNPTSLEFGSEEVVPLVDVQTMQIPFVERNDRSDWEKEFYIAIRVEYDVNEFNQRVIEFKEDNLKYQALLETLTRMRDNLLFEEGGYKYVFKVKEPVEVNVFKYNGNYYQIVAVNMNLTSVAQGFFGNETELYFGLESDSSFTDDNNYYLDFTEIQVLLGKETTVLAPVEEKEHRVHINKRNWNAQVTINFNGNTADKLIEQEVHALTTNNREKYNIRLKRGDGSNDTDFDYTRVVYITNGNVIYVNNSIVSITFQVERA